MKTIALCTAVFLSLLSSSALAECPANLSFEDTVTCITVEGYGQNFNEYLARQRAEFDVAPRTNTSTSREEASPGSQTPEIEIDFTDLSDVFDSH